VRKEVSGKGKGTKKKVSSNELRRLVCSLGRGDSTKKNKKEAKPKAPLKGQRGLQPEQWLEMKNSKQKREGGWEKTKREKTGITGLWGRVPWGVATTENSKKLVYTDVQTETTVGSGDKETKGCK